MKQLQNAELRLKMHNMSAVIADRLEKCTDSINGSIWLVKRIDIMIRMLD